MKNIRKELMKKRQEKEAYVLMNSKKQEEIVDHILMIIFVARLSRDLVCSLSVVVCHVC